VKHRITAGGAVAALTLASVTALAAPAMAGSSIRSVACQGRTDFYRTFSNSAGTSCYANAGDMSIYTQAVYGLSPGNNNGQIRYIGDDGFAWSSARGHTSQIFYFSGTVTATEIALW
jgi:hypothetical protein